MLSAFAQPAPVVEAQRRVTTTIETPGFEPRSDSRLSTPAELSLPRLGAGDSTAPTIEDIREIKEPNSVPRTIDLITPQDDLWDRIRTGFSMQQLYGPLVDSQQVWYTARPQMMKVLAERSRRYLYHIVDELEKRGMPTELALLPMVESAFNPMALSSAKASGLWQFIPSTGKRYELQQNWWYDGRRDILASTTAALDYLQFLYDMHGDWQLALASYNWGENAVARAIERNKAKRLPTDYASLTMPAETRYYVPKLQALKNIIARPEKFGISLDPIPNQPYFVTVEKTKDIDIKLAAKLAEMSVEELMALNPAHNRLVLSAAQTQKLVLPADRADVFLANLESHTEPLSSWVPYTMKNGDVLEKLAAVHGIAVAKLRAANGITARTRVGPGLQILLPMKGSDAAAEPLPVGYVPPIQFERASRTETRKIIHTVARGDTLPSIASKYKVSVEDLRRWNSIGRLLAGQQLTIEQQVAVSTWNRKPAPAKGKKAAAAQTTRKPATASAAKKQPQRARI
ncbi:MAG: transglycosylase SLT domain-containing protein [Burkholderiales bacterium]